MELILPFHIPPSPKKINIKEPLLFIGSCFSEEIGKKMSERKFSAIINPHGILYNPASLCIALADYITKKQYTESDIFHFNGLWQSFNHHGRFSEPSAEKCLEKINREIILAHDHLKNAEWLAVTFGSAYAYVHEKNNSIVGNCHKVPSGEFQKILLDKELIVSNWKKFVEDLQVFNPKLKIIFTVSPVRYVRDGVIENNRSKGVLLSAVHELVEQNKNCFYFPAYEIVIDELRDYRFFKEDLVHPNETAINYVWERFEQTFCDEETKKFLSELEPLLKNLNHRALHSSADGFKKQTEEKIKLLEAKFKL